MGWTVFIPMRCVVVTRFIVSQGTVKTKCANYPPWIQFSHVCRLEMEGVILYIVCSCPSVSCDVCELIDPQFWGFVFECVCDINRTSHTYWIPSLYFIPCHAFEVLKLWVKLGYNKQSAYDCYMKYWTPALAVSLCYSMKTTAVIFLVLCITFGLVDTPFLHMHFVQSRIWQETSTCTGWYGGWYLSSYYKYLLI